MLGSPITIRPIPSKTVARNPIRPPRRSGLYPVRTFDVPRTQIRGKAIGVPSGTALNISSAIEGSDQTPARYSTVFVLNDLKKPALMSRFSLSQGAQPGVVKMMTSFDFV